MHVNVLLKLAGNILKLATYTKVKILLQNAHWMIKNTH